MVGAAWGFGLAAINALASAVAFDYCRSWPDSGLSQPRTGSWLASFSSWRCCPTVLRGWPGEGDRSRTAPARADSPHGADRAASGRDLGGTRRSRPGSVLSRGGRVSQLSGGAERGLFRYEPDGTALLLAAADEPGLQKMPVGERSSLDGDNVAAMVRRSGRAARMGSHDHAAGAAAARIRALGLCWLSEPDRGGQPGVGSGRRGFVATRRLPPSAEQQVSDFADLIAIAIANVQARAELTASRARSSRPPMTPGGVSRGPA